jgi:hypothetical protein
MKLVAEQFTTAFRYGWPIHERGQRNLIGYPVHDGTRRQVWRAVGDPGGTIHDEVGIRA